MSRPDAARWGVLGLEADPTPGSPDETTVLAGTLTVRAGGWLDTADGLLALGDWGMVGLYARAYHDRLAGLPGEFDRMGRLAGDAADRLRSWGDVMERWQGQADRVLARAEDTADEVTRRQSALAAAQAAVAEARVECGDLIHDPSAGVIDRQDAAARCSDLSDAASMAGRDLDAANAELEALRAQAAGIRDGYREDAEATARVIDDLIDPPADGAGGGAWWQDALSGVEGYGAGVLSGVLSPIAALGDGIWNLMAAQGPSQDEMYPGDSHALRDLVDQAMTWLAGHTWDPEAFWGGAQWGDVDVTLAGVAATVLALAAAAPEVAAAAGGSAIAGALSGIGGTLAVEGAAGSGAAAAGLLTIGGLGIAGVMVKTNIDNIEEYGQRAEQTKGISAEERAKLDSWDTKFRPDDETYLKHRKTFDNPKYFNQKTGEWNPPGNRGAVEGTVRNDVRLSEGTIIDRYGDEGGGFLAPEGTPFPERSMPPGTDLSDYHRYRVTNKGADEMGLTQSKTQAWFDQPGGGTQYYIPKGGKEMTIQEMIHAGWIEEIP